jgi:hypothetical protein
MEQRRKTLTSNFPIDRVVNICELFTITAIAIGQRFRKTHLEA